MSLPVAILAGGLGTRLLPKTQTVPKALIDVRGEPFISHQLRLLQAGGIEHVVLCVSYMGEMIRDFVADGRRFGIKVEYVFDGPVRLGTAGAIAKALPALGGEFFVLYGDSYLPCDYRAVEDAFRRSGQLALMTVFHNRGRWDASNVEFSGGRLLAYDKKNRTARMEHIDYGLGAFRRAAFEILPTGQVCDLAALYADLLARGQLAGFEVPQRFYEIGSFDGLRELSEHLAKQTP